MVQISIGGAFVCIRSRSSVGDWCRLKLGIWGARIKTVA